MDDIVFYGRPDFRDDDEMPIVRIGGAIYLVVADYYVTLQRPLAQTTGRFAAPFILMVEIEDFLTWVFWLRVLQNDNMAYRVVRSGPMGRRLLVLDPIQSAEDTARVRQLWATCCVDPTRVHAVDPDGALERRAWQAWLGRIWRRMTLAERLTWWQELNRHQETDITLVQNERPDFMAIDPEGLLPFFIH